MLKMLKSREFTQALNMYRSVEKEGLDHYFLEEELFSAFIHSAIRMGKMDVVERMTRLMKRNGIVPRREFWRVTMKMLSSRKQGATCLTLALLWGKQMPLDKMVYTVLVNAALEAKQFDHALRILNRYSEVVSEPEDHVLFFRAYVALNDLASAQAKFEKLGNEVTTMMLNLLLLIYVNNSKPECGWNHIVACHELEKSKNENIVDSISYNTIMKGFTQIGNSNRCFDCLFTMREHNLEPDDVTFGTLLDSCIASNNEEAARKVVNLMIAGERPMDTVICTLIIKGFLRASYFDKAVELYEEMRRRSECQPDIITYSVLIKAFVDKHELEYPLKLVRDMKAIGLVPDDIIVSCLLEGCRQSANHLGKQIFDEMILAGVTPSETTLIAMVKLHGHCGAHDEAYTMVSTWQEKYNTTPSVVHYTCLMSGCLRTKSYAQAWSAYQLMCDKGVHPDETAVSTLLPGLVVSRQFDNVLMLLKQALEGPEPLDIPASTLNGVLSQMLARKSTNLAQQLRLLMTKAKIPVTAHNSQLLD